MKPNHPEKEESGDSFRSEWQRAQWFRTTQWTDLFQAKDKEQSGVARVGLSRICDSYWPPIYTYLRRRGHSSADAEDLTQGFFQHLLSHDWLENVHPEGGKFRSYLLKSLKNFCTNAHTKACAEKRGGKVALMLLDDIRNEEEQIFRASDALTPEEVFDRRWAEALMQRAINRLREEYMENGKADLYDALQDLVPEESYAQIGARLDLTEGAVKTAVHRIRARLSNILRMEIRATISDPGEVDLELQYLREALSR